MIALLGSFVVMLLASGGRAGAHEATLHGLVLARLPKSGTVVVRYDPVFGKPTGTATFRVAPAPGAVALGAGMTIDATVDSDSTPWTLSGIHARGREAITGHVAEEAVPVPQVLRSVHHVVVGEYAPTTELIDQRGKKFSLRDFREQTVVMAFAYTRCKDARECPLVTSRFRQLQERFRGQPVHLVEVSLDPEYDRPAVLTRYGRTFDNDPARWTLATGDPEKVLDFAAQFDVTAFPDERVGLIHPERTVLIDKYGAIRELIDEGAWTADEIAAAVQHDERLASNPIERLDLWLSAAAISVCGNSVAGFSGFTDLLTVIGIVATFTFLLYRLGRGIAKGAA